MVELKCDRDCFKCLLDECLCDDLTEEELKFSEEFDREIKVSRIQEKIAQIDDPKKRAIARYRQTPKGKAMIHRMNTNEFAKQRFKRYEKSEKGKARRQRYEERPDRQAYRKNYMKTYNKEYQEVVRKNKEIMRLNLARQQVEVLLKTGEVSVLDGHRNRPREKQKYERILAVLSEMKINFNFTYDIELGIIRRGDVV